MSVLLTILKILGIILLVLIGLILLLFLTALFLPVRYRINGEYEKDFHLEAKAGWLCRLIYFHFKLDGKDKKGILRVLGIPVMQIPPDENKKRNKKTKSPKSTRKSKKKSRNKKNRNKKNWNKNQQTHELQAKKEIQAKHEEQLLSQQQIKSELKTRSEQTENAQKNQKARKENQNKRFSFLKRIKQFFTRLKQRLMQLPEKIKAAFSKIDDIKSLWMDENNKKSTGLVLSEIKYLLLHYGPTKIHADVRYSTGDPATTGKVLGVLSMIPFLYQKGVHVTPDFVSEDLYAKGYLIGKGHIRMMHLIRTLLHFHKDKNITTWIKDNL